MSRLTRSQQLANLHNEALLRFDKIQSCMRDERLQALKDRRFYSIAGAQWEGPLNTQFENKPRLEVNKIHLSIIRAINDYRNNRITVNFRPKDGRTDELSETLNGMYRADEQDSISQEAYDNAFEEAIGGGFGAWRLRADYEDEEDMEDEHQRIRIEPIFDADSCVFFDLDALHQDKSDARYCFVMTPITHEVYRERYDDEPTTWRQQIHQREFDWLTPDFVWIAEYYLVVHKQVEVLVYQSPTGQEKRYTEEELGEDEDLLPFLEATGHYLARRIKKKTKRVHKYVMSGNSILEDCGLIAGRCIPIIPVYGKRWVIDGVERCMGHVRLATDPQRLKNMQVSKLAEIASISTVEKPIFTPSQVKGHEYMWSEDNLKNWPYLLINPLTDPNGNPTAVGPQAYTKPPQIPPAMAALLQLTEEDMQDILGSRRSAEEVAPNTSGLMMELAQARLDMQTFIYISNMGKAVKRCGEVWLSMAKEVYVEDGRRVKLVNEQGEISSAELYQPGLNMQGVPEVKNDIASAKQDVVVDIGPAGTTKRASTVRSLAQMLQITQDPESQQVLTAMAMMNMEGEGINEVRQYFRRKLLRIGAVKPTSEEAQQLAAEAQNQQPNPQAIYLQAAAQEAAAKAAAARADTVLTAAKAEKTKAETVETLAGISRDNRDSVVSMVEKLTQPPKMASEPIPAQSLPMSEEIPGRLQ